MGWKQFTLPQAKLLPRCQILTLWKHVYQIETQPPCHWKVSMIWAVVKGTHTCWVMNMFLLQFVEARHLRPQWVLAAMQWRRRVSFYTKYFFSQRYVCAYKSFENPTRDLDDVAKPQLAVRPSCRAKGLNLTFHNHFFPVFDVRPSFPARRLHLKFQNWNFYCIFSLFPFDV